MKVMRKVEGRGMGEVDGDKEGKGTYIFKETGMKMHGDWDKGEIKRGRWIYPNGLFFEGDFKNNKPFGEGTWYFKNGN